MIFRFLLVWVKLVFQKLSYESFHMLYLSLLPVSFMKNFGQLICIVISLEVLEDGSIFSSIARCQKRGSFVCKRRRTEAAKTKVYIFVYEIFTNKFFKNYTVIVMWSHVLAKWRHCKLKPFQSGFAFSYLQLFGNKCNNNCFFYLYWQCCSLSLHWPRKLDRYLGLEQNFPLQI